MFMLQPIKFESKFWPLPVQVIWLSLQKAVPEDYQRFLVQKSQLMGQHSGTAFAALPDKRQHRILTSLWLSQQAVICSLQT